MYEEMKKILLKMKEELIKEIAKLEDEGANLDGIKIILSMRRGERE